MNSTDVFRITGHRRGSPLLPEPGPSMLQTGKNRPKKSRSASRARGKQQAKPPTGTQRATVCGGVALAVIAATLTWFKAKPARHRAARQVTAPQQARFHGWGHARADAPRQPTSEAAALVKQRMGSSQGTRAVTQAEHQRIAQQVARQHRQHTHSGAGTSQRAGSSILQNSKVTTLADVKKPECACCQSDLAQEARF